MDNEIAQIRSGNARIEDRFRVGSSPNFREQVSSVASEFVSPPLGSYLCAECKQRKRGAGGVSTE